MQSDPSAAVTASKLELQTVEYGQFVPCHCGSSELLTQSIHGECQSFPNVLLFSVGQFIWKHFTEHWWASCDELLCRWSHRTGNKYLSKISLVIAPPVRWRCCCWQTHFFLGVCQLQKEASDGNTMLTSGQLLLHRVTKFCHYIYYIGLGRHGC